MIKFRLHSFLGGNIERNIAKTNPDGSGYITARVSFSPNVVYTTSDPIIEKYILGEAGDVREKSVSTPQLKAALDAGKIPYETVVCRSCSGSKPSYRYNPFEILEKSNE